MDQVLGCRPISRPVASLDSLSCGKEEEQAVNEDVAQHLKTKFGKGTINEEECPKCGTKVELTSAGLHESDSGCLRLYSEDEEFVCPKCNFKVSPAELSEVEASTSSTCSSSEKDPKDSNVTSKEPCFTTEKKRKKPPSKSSNNKDVLQQMFEESEKREIERFEKYMKQMEEKEESTRREEEQEREREKRENERMEKQMTMLVQMQMQVMSMFVGQPSGVAACPSYDNNDDFQL